jgi:soluble lytic murein transglycosylase-like protein
MFGSLAQADLYRRVDSNGHVTYTDHPEGSGYMPIAKMPRHRAEDLHPVTPIGSKPVQKLGLPSRKAGSAVVVSGEGPRLFLFRPSVSASVSLRAPDGRANDFSGMIERVAQMQGLDPWLLHAVIRAESAYNPLAVSPKGAKGLMQLMPATAMRYGVQNPWDPEENVSAGARYLRDLLGLFGDDVELAVAAYNAGEGSVLKFGRKVPPFEETQDYVSKVLEYYRK